MTRFFPNFTFFFFLFYRQRKGSALKDLELCELLFLRTCRFAFQPCSFYNVLFLEINSFQFLMSALFSLYSLL